MILSNVLFDIAHQWFVLVTTPPQVWLWAFAVPGIARRLRKFRKVPYLGPLIVRFVDSPASSLFERAGWAFLALFVLVAAIAAPTLLLSQERKNFDSERKALQAQLDRERPQVLIEPLSAGEIRARALADPTNPILPDGAYRPAYLLVRAPDSEAILFSVRNLPGKNVAREIQVYRKIWFIDEDGRQIELALPPRPSGREVLYPDQSVTRPLNVPKGTFYNARPGHIRVKLVVAYRGQTTDTYFYSVVLRVALREGPPSRPRDLDLESMDEGVVAGDPSRLLDS